jgi:hypothetical protein
VPMTGWSRAIRARDPAIATAGTSAHAVTAVVVSESLALIANRRNRRLGRRDHRRDLGDSVRLCRLHGTRGLGLNVGAMLAMIAVIAGNRGRRDHRESRCGEIWRRTSHGLGREITALP